MVDDVGGTGQPEESLETTVNKLSASVDARFDAVDAAFVEQRQYTEFAFEKLERAMNEKFAVVNADLAGVKTDVSGVKTDVSGVKTDVASVRTELRVVASGLSRVERKLDQLVDRLFPEPGPKTPAESQ